MNKTLSVEPMEPILIVVYMVVGLLVLITCGCCLGVLRDSCRRRKKEDHYGDLGWRIQMREKMIGEPSCTTTKEQTMV